VTESKISWAVELIGPEDSKEFWKDQLRKPFDPYVEEIEDTGFVLRSSEFEGVDEAIAARDIAARLLRAINVTMSCDGFDPMTMGSLLKLVDGQKPIKHLFGEFRAEFRARFGIAKLVHTDALGNIIEPAPRESKAQRWMRAAAKSPQIAAALSYLEGKPDWVSLYKAYEALKNLPCDAVTRDEISRFTRTANTGGRRHHLGPKENPPEVPMTLNEAQNFILKWLSAAVDLVLAKHA